MKGLSFNLGVSMFTFFTTALISFWLTPFIINNLGAEAYGFIPLTQNLISILTILTVAISSVIARYFTIAISRQDFHEAQQFFNTYLLASFFGMFAIMSIIIPLTFVIENIIEIPHRLIPDVKLAIIFSGIMIVFTLFNSLFLAAPFSQNKLYINKIIDVINTIIKGLLTFFLLVIFTPQIWYVNLSAMIAVFISLILSIVIFRKLYPSIKVNFSSFNISKLKELLSSGLWISIGQLGVVLFLSVELLVVNITLGATMAGIYAAIIQFPILLRNVSSSISVVFAPIIYKQYASNNINSMVDYSNKSVKINGIIIALPAAILCGFAEPILILWLGSEYVQFKWILILNSLYLIITLSPLPLSHVFTAVNKLKIPGLTTIVFGLVNLILAFYLSGFTSLGLYGIVIAGSVALILKNTLFIPYYCSVVTKQPVYIYYKGLFKPIIGSVFIIFMSIILQKIYLIDNWKILIITINLVITSYIIFVFVFLLSKSEKVIIIKKLLFIVGHNKN